VENNKRGEMTGVEQQVRRNDEWGTTSKEERQAWSNKHGKTTSEEQQVGRNDK
jgi:hypothetical protein